MAGFIESPDSAIYEPDTAVVALEVEERQPMELAEIAKICASEIDAAKERNKTEYRGDNARAMDYFHGHMDADTPPQKNRSRAKSSDVADVIGWMMPGLMRVFFAGETFGEFSPMQPEDEGRAQQASDYINFVFLQECDGYSVGWNSMHDALLLRVGVIKYWWDPEPEYIVSTLTGLNEADYVAVTAEPNIEVEEHKEYPDPDAPPPLEAPPMAQGMPMEGYPGPNGPAAPPGPPEASAPSMLHDLRIRKTIRSGRPKVASVPPEEFLIDAQATGTQDARFLCHWSRVTRAELVCQGFDRDKVMELPIGSALDMEPEAQSRNYHVWNDRDGVRTDPATQEVDRYECYVQADIDDDGKTEWIQVIMAGGTGENNILAAEKWGDPVPFAVLKPYDIPHRFLGRSVADDCMDVQQIKTVLLRQVLDNVYLANNPIKGAIEGSVVNMDQLLNPATGEVIRMRQQGDVWDMPVPFVAAAAFQVIEYLDSIIERRTGISRATMALDPDALANQTATAVQKQTDAAYSKIELIARNFAEGGFSDLFCGLLRLSVKHHDRVRMVKLRGQWVPVDPREWNADMDVAINTGLGAGSKDRDMSMLMQILQMQEKIVANTGADNPMVPPDKVWNTLNQLVQVAGLKNTEQYFAKLTPDQVKAAMAPKGGEDPKAAEAKAKLEMQQQELQQRLQLEQQKMQMDAATQQQKAAQDAQTAQAKFQFERELAVQKLQDEMALARFKAEQDALAYAQAAEAKAAADERIAIQKMNMDYRLRVEEMDREAKLKLAQIQFGMNTPGDEGNINRRQQ